MEDQGRFDAGGQVAGEFPQLCEQAVNDWLEERKLFRWHDKVFILQ